MMIMKFYSRWGAKFRHVNLAREANYPASVPTFLRSAPLKLSDDLTTLSV